MIAVIGETPYAEGNGDIGKRSLEHARLHPEDLAVLDRVSGKGAPVVTVFISGRPLYVNKELNRSDAFVAAWLPGTEGQGVADLLVRGRDAASPASCPTRWPASPCQTPLNAGDEDYAPLFQLGYGLRNGQQATAHRAAARGDRRAVRRRRRRRDARRTSSSSSTARTSRPTRATSARRTTGAAPSSATTRARRRSRTRTSRRGASDVNVQQDARKITWKGGAGQFYLQSPARPTCVPTSTATARSCSTRS